MYLLLQGVPEDIDLSEIKEKLSKIKNVDSLHHTHIWSLDGEHHVLTSHLKLKHINDFSQILAVKQQAKEVLQQYDFAHHTLETELDTETCRLLDEKNEVFQLDDLSLRALDDSIKDAALKYAKDFYFYQDCSKEEALERGIVKAEMEKRNL